MTLGICAADHECQARTLKKMHLPANLLPGLVVLQSFLMLELHIFASDPSGHGTAFVK